VKPSALQGGAEGGVELQQRTRNAVAGRPGLAFGPPPVTFTRTSSLSAVPVTVNGCDTVARRVSSGK